MVFAFQQLNEIEISFHLIAVSDIVYSFCLTFIEQHGI